MATIFAGAKPIRKLGKLQFHMLDFLLRYPGWHTMGTNAKTRRTLWSLVSRGVVVTNEHGQARFQQTPVQ